MTAYHYPADTCMKPRAVDDTIRERLLSVLLVKTLPYLVKTEMSPSTSAELRDLITQINHITQRG